MAIDTYPLLLRNITIVGERFRRKLSKIILLTTLVILLLSKKIRLRCYNYDNNCYWNNTCAGQCKPWKGKLSVY